MVSSSRLLLCHAMLCDNHRNRQGSSTMRLMPEQKVFVCGSYCSDVAFGWLMTQMVHAHHRQGDGSDDGALPVGMAAALVRQRLAITMLH